MKDRSPTPYRVGSLRDFAAWTKRVMHDPDSARGEPRTWYDSDATAHRAAADQVSAEAMVEPLSPGNLSMLAAIRDHQPTSMRELATLTGARKPACHARSSASRHSGSWNFGMVPVARASRR